MHLPFNPHHQHIVAQQHTANPRVEILRNNGRLEFRNAQAELGEHHRMRRDLIGCCVAAEHIHIGHPGNRAQRGTYLPFEQLALVLQRQVGVLDSEHEHLAERRAHRRKTALNREGQLVEDARQPFVHLLTRPVDIRTVNKIQGDVSDGVFGRGAQHRLSRNTQQLRFQGIGHALFDFFRRHSRHFENNLDLRGRDVGVGINRQIEPGTQAQPRQHQCHHTHEQALGEGKADQLFQHVTRHPVP